MTYESLRNVFVYSGVAGLVLAAVAVVLFFLLDIPDAFAYLTGKKRKKGIKQIINEGSTPQKPAKKKKEKKVEAAAPRARKNVPVKAKRDEAITERLSARDRKMEQQESEQTTLLTQNQPQALDDGGNLTTLLVDTAAMEQIFDETQPFTVEFEITFLNSDVLIG